MTLSQRIEADYITAYKAKDSVRLTVLRLLKTAAKNLVVERRQRPLEEGDWLDLVSKQCKQRQDSIEQYRAANRPDLAEVEEAELVILRSYMPEQMSGDELAAAINGFIIQLGASGPKDMGKVMQALTAAHKGQYDGKEASEKVRQALQGR